MRTRNNNNKILWGALATLLLIVIIFIPVSAQSDDNAFAMPYIKYIISNGCHPDLWEMAGTYNWCAIDLVNQNGKNILSPINGTVYQTGPNDNTGSSYLIIDNTRWRVFLLHGIYSVQNGQKLTLGQQVGTESCIAGPGQCSGDHTHLGVFDKKNNVWVDPRTISTTTNNSTETQQETQQETPVSASFKINKQPSLADAIKTVTNNPKTNKQTWIILAGVIFTTILLANRKPFGFFLASGLLAWSVVLVQPTYAQEKQEYIQYIEQIKIVWQIDVENIAPLPEEIKNPPQSQPPPKQRENSTSLHKRSAVLGRRHHSLGRPMGLKSQSSSHGHANRIMR